jgi:molybdenum cofactor cytidylyltransferase
VSRVAGLVLAAGSASRFGSPKALALIDGRPMLEHVVGVALAAGLEPIVVVLGVAAETIEPAVDWRAARVVRNPDPARGLSSSLRVGLDALAADSPRVDAAVILLGDQPRTTPATIAALLAARRADRSIVAPRYAEGGGANPVLLERSAFDLAAATEGDRGLGPLIAARPEIATFVDVPGTNVDVDTPADLARV